MSPDQRTRALRLADALDELDSAFSATGVCGEAAALLRELAAEPERVPLTSERAIEIVYDKYGCERHGIDLVRAVERAHGIV